jgi:hypothetical protein
VQSLHIQAEWSMHVQPLTATNSAATVRQTLQLQHCNQCVGYHYAVHIGGLRPTPHTATFLTATRSCRHKVLLSLHSAGVEAVKQPYAKRPHTTTGPSAWYSTKQSTGQLPAQQWHALLQQLNWQCQHELSIRYPNSGYGIQTHSMQNHCMKTTSG